MSIKLVDVCFLWLGNVHMCERVLTLYLRSGGLRSLLFCLFRPISRLLGILFGQLVGLGHRSFLTTRLDIAMECLVLSRLGISDIVGEQLNRLLVVLVQGVGLPLLRVLAVAEHLGGHLVAQAEGGVRVLVQAVHFQIHWQLFILERTAIEVWIGIVLRLTLQATVQGSLHPSLDAALQQISALLVSLIGPFLGWAEHMVCEFVID